MAAYDLSAASNAGAAASTAAFGSQTRFIQLCFPGSASSTGGIRFAIDPAPVVTSTGAGGTFLPANWPLIVRVNPGEKLSVISNDAGTPKVSVSELSN